MSASFVSASSQSLSQTTVPITAVPFTVGMWVRPTTTGVTKRFWSLCSTSAALFTTPKFDIGQTGGDTWFIEVAEDIVAPNTDNPAVGTVTANVWAFVLGRFITSTNRRLSVLQFDGSSAHVQGTLSLTPGGPVDVMTVGALNTGISSSFFEGQLGEFWYTNTDIQADGAQTQESLLRQLAYGGPFSVPHIAKNIVEYRSLRKAVSSDRDDESEVYFRGPFGKRTWTNVGSTTVSHHPPLPYWYVKPEQNERVLTI